MSNQSQEHILKGEAIDHLAEALRSAGWRASIAVRGSRQGDLLCHQGQRSYAVEVKAMGGKARKTLLRALLADAILRARAAAHAADAEPLAVVAAPRLSIAMMEELHRYVGEFAPGVAWGALDRRGRFELHGPDLEEVRPSGVGWIRPDVPGAPASDGSAQDPFSDLGQWMIKVLFASRVPVPYLSVPRGPVRGVRDLARKAAVSPASASRLVSSLKAMGHIEQSSCGMELVRVRGLFQRWRAAALRSPRERYVRFLFPAQDPVEQMESLLERRQKHAAIAENHDDMPSGRPGARACLALFSASRKLGLGWVRGAPVHVYCEDLSDRALEELGVHPVEGRHDAAAILRQPRFPASVFRACVVRDGIAVADALQCWIDVVDHPARGAELAEEILERLGLDDGSPSD